MWDWAVFPDRDNDLVVFVNMTREGFCSWLADGAVGSPPMLTPLVDWHHDTGPDRELTGVVGVGTPPVELWHLDEGTGPCDSTDESTEPFAVGEIEIKINVMRAGAEPDMFRGRGWSSTGTAPSTATTSGRWASWTLTGPCACWTAPDSWSPCADRPRRAAGPQSSGCSASQALTDASCSPRVGGARCSARPPE